MTLKKISKSLGLDQESCRELVKLLIDTSRSDIEKLKNANKDGDTAKITAAAHSIKGASGNLGFIPLSEIAAGLEKNATIISSHAVKLEAHKMEDELNRINDSI